MSEIALPGFLGPGQRQGIKLTGLTLVPQPVFLLRSTTGKFTDLILPKGDLPDVTLIVADPDIEITLDGQKVPECDATTFRACATLRGGASITFMAYNPTTGQRMSPVTTGYSPRKAAGLVR